MPTPADIISVARGELGFVETPVNITKYWAELEPAFQGQSWCAAFVSWVFKHAGLPLPDMGKPYGFSYCPYAERWAKASGMWDEDGLYQPGDIVLFGNTIAEHTGIVVSDDGRVITTIEGNTSSGEAGSQTNGGGVYLRQRPHGPWVRGVVAMSRRLTAPPSATPAAPASSIPPVFTKPTPAPAPTPAPKPAVPPFPGVTRKGSRGAAVRAVQGRLLARGWHVGVVDGIFGSITDAAVRAFQKEKGLTVDGVVGPLTWAALWTSPVTK